jgi:hypothetical protein
MLRTGRGHQRSAGLTFVVVGCVAMALLLSPVAQADDVAPIPPPVATPEPTPVPAPVPAPVVLPTALGSWCETLFPPYKPKTEKRKAQELMAGKADMGPGGVYYLSEHPNWKPQSGTDTSGDRHVHSLDWALPLLYRGVHKQNPAMVARFQQLIHYWIADNNKKRGAWVDGSIYGGLRTQTLVCAAQTLNDPIITAAALRDSQTMIRSFTSRREVSTGANNTDLTRQIGALGAYCWVADPPGRARAWQNVVSIARGLVFDDGSDVEGSPHYAMYIEKLMQQAEAAATTCGIPADPLPGLRGLLYQFVAQAVRPDFKLQSLGDTVNESLRGTFGVGDWRADWIRSAGTAGTPPTPVYTAFDGGYVFGRAGWRPQPGGPDTYYSMRFSSARPATAHTHDDGAAMTFYSRGVEWIGDPGPYRYENGSSLRWFMKSRPAHSSFTVSGIKRASSNGVRKLTSTSDWTSGGNDTTCVADRTWGNVDVTRCSVYVRSVDAMIVADYVMAKKIKGKKAQKQAAPRVFTQRWQLTPGIAAAGVNGVITLSAGDKRVEIYKGGPGEWDVQGARNGSSVGWFTGAWGEKKPGSVLSRSLALNPKGDVQTFVTVIVPRVDGEAVPVTIDANGVTVTRNGVAITTGLPVPR